MSSLNLNIKHTSAPVAYVIYKCCHNIIVNKLNIISNE